jgi:flagellar biosynthesis protein FlhF
VFDRLVDWNVRSADALKLIDQAMEHYAKDSQPTPDGLFAATVTEMLRPLQHAPGIRSQRGQRRVVALVGGTGSGKTSLAAKLAARYAYEDDLTVALVSMDTYRIAAVDQLRTFAEIMGFPLEIAYTPDDFARITDSLDADLVIVDTAGRSPLNSRQLDELQIALAARRPDEVHLALPATARFDDIALTLEAFAPVQPTATIVTKLDETRTLGMLHNLAQLGGPPVSFFSTGQAIPEDLHEAQPGFLAGWAEGLGYGA